jgi:SAM-dependent methyltransferase
VLHDLCLHWAEDPVGQLVQCARALRPDGLLLATLFGAPRSRSCAPRWPGRRRRRPGA